MIIGIVLSAVMALEVPLADSEAERRAQSMFAEIKCVVCEGEPISHSGAELAQDMRTHIRAEIADGRSDQEIRDDLAARYGERVLLRPSTRGAGWLLWLAPLFILAAGVIVLLRFFSTRRHAVAELKPDQDR